jgi:hypothetical protein
MLRLGQQMEVPTVPPEVRSIEPRELIFCTHTDTFEVSPV